MITDVKTQIFMDWPYEKALEWMNDASQRVKEDPARVFVACGSHLETVISLGRHASFDGDNENRGYVIRRVDRGGGITAHEPGQLVLYPVLNLFQHGLAIKTFVTMLEMAMVNFLNELKIIARLKEGCHGVFVADAKIGFLGLRVKDHVTSHGLALNVQNDARVFSLFNPCGIKNLPITSAKHQVLLPLPLSFYVSRLLENFKRILHSAR